MAEATAEGMAIGDHPEGHPNKGAGEISPVNLAPVLLMIVLFKTCAPTQPSVHPTLLIALFLLVLFDLARTSATHRTTVCMCFEPIASANFE